MGRRFDPDRAHSSSDRLYTNAMKVVDLRIVQVLSFAASVTTLAVTPWTNYDPINPVKVLTLTGLSAFAVGLLISKFRNFKLLFMERKLFLVFPFIIWMIVALLVSGADVRQQVWGVFGRNTGLLTYFALTSVFLAMALIQTRDIAKIISKSLIITNILFSTYLLLQFFNKDPIRWSQQDLFGTLGNTNFASAFLGMSVLIYVALVLFSRSSTSFRSLLGLLVLFEVFLLLKVGSLQGIVIFALGSATLFSIWLFDAFKARFIRILYWLSVPVLVLFALAGIANKGPFAGLLYQQSNVYRADYMGTALRMIKANPIFGVGIDSYDGWYRTYRGFISAYRTSLSRTTNTSHNIFLDIGASGGIPLLIGYLIIVFYTLFCAVGLLKRRTSLSHFDIAILAIWIAYLVQSLISINQVGVGVWGWLLSGAIVAKYWQLRTENQDKASTKDESRERNKSKKRKSAEQIPASATLISSLALALGISLAAPPLVADANLRKALDTGNLSAVMNIGNTLGSNSFQLEKSVEVVSSKGNKELTYKLAKALTERFPRSLFGWQVLGANTNLQQERDSALGNIKKIDPWLPCFDPNPGEKVSKWFYELPVDKQVELAKWWGIVDFNVKGPGEKIKQSWNQDQITKHLQTICG